VAERRQRNSIYQPTWALSSSADRSAVGCRFWEIDRQLDLSHLGKLGLEREALAVVVTDILFSSLFRACPVRAWCKSRGMRASRHRSLKVWRKEWKTTVLGSFSVLWMKRLNHLPSSSLSLAVAERALVVQHATRPRVALGGVSRDFRVWRSG
jgi:hypothetical protein